MKKHLFFEAATPFVGDALRSLTFHDGPDYDRDRHEGQLTRWIRQPTPSRRSRTLPNPLRTPAGILPNPLRTPAGIIAPAEKWGKQIGTGRRPRRR